MRAAARGGRSGYRAVQGGTPLRPSSSTVQGGAKGGGLPFPLSDPFFDDWSSRNNSGGSDNCHISGQAFSVLQTPHAACRSRSGVHEPPIQRRPCDTRGHRPATALPISRCRASPPRSPCGLHICHTPHACGGSGGDGTGELGLDPLLIALLKKVPTPDNGWPGPNRVRWFRTFAMNVSQIYDGDGEPVELKIELEGKEAVK